MVTFWTAPDRGEAVEFTLEPVSEGAASSSVAGGEVDPGGTLPGGSVGVRVDPTSPMAVETSRQPTDNLSADSSEKSGEKPAVKQAKVPMRRVGKNTTNTA